MVTTIMPREDELKGWLCVKEKIFDNLFTAAPRTPLAILALGSTCFFMSVSRLTRSPGHQPDCGQNIRSGIVRKYPGGGEPGPGLHKCTCCCRQPIVSNIYSFPNNMLR